METFRDRVLKEGDMLIQVQHTRLLHDAARTYVEANYTEAQIGRNEAKLEGVKYAMVQTARHRHTLFRIRVQDVPLESIFRIRDWTWTFTKNPQVPNYGDAHTGTTPQRGNGLPLGARWIAPRFLRNQSLQ